ncbi:MAG: D-alanyl-D-alanine carboxypeptidase family protein [Hyphomicrobiaceae bacterium]
MRLRRYLGAMLALLGLGSAPVAAGPALLFEASSGKVLYAEDADNHWHPASLTKIMTAYVVFEAIREGKIALDGKLVCTENANKEPPSKIGLPVGAEMTVELGLKALIVKSANDVAVMLAEGVSGSVEAFVARMNATAKKLGMTRTHFVNANGLPAPEQVTTARDLAKLARAVVRDFPQYAELWAMPVVQVGKIKLASHNGLLRTFEGADGLKTGFICDSGFNVVASATRDGTRLMAVVLGEPSPHERSLRAASLLEHGFQHYGWKNFFDTTDIDNMPMSEQAKPVVSIRANILSWDCGHRPRVVKAQTLKTLKERERLRKKIKGQTAKSHDSDDADGAAQPGNAAKPAALSNPVKAEARTDSRKTDAAAKKTATPAPAAAKPAVTKPKPKPAAAESAAPLKPAVAPAPKSAATKPASASN